jgi:hypothetical protein
MKIAKRIAVTLFVILALSLAFLAYENNGRTTEIACCWHMWVLRVDEAPPAASQAKIAEEFDKQIPLRTVAAARYHTPAYDYDLK